MRPPGNWRSPVPVPSKMNGLRDGKIPERSISTSQRMSKVIDAWVGAMRSTARFRFR